jgi:hypothetical protein
MHDAKIEALSKELPKVEEVKPRRADRSMKIRSSVKAGLTAPIKMPD